MSQHAVTKPASGGPVEQRLQNVRRWAEDARKFEHAKLACQVMAGFELLELKQEMGVSAGRPKNSASGAEFPKWDEAVRQEAGIARRTADNWMAMADACKARFAKLDPRARLAKLMATPVNEWTDKDARLIHETVRELSDGHNQLEFMAELGLVKGKADKSPGGDVLWEKWVKKHHAELIQDGEVPKRTKAPKEIREEFEAWRIAELKQQLSPEERVADANRELVHCADELHDMAGMEELTIAGEPELKALRDAARALARACETILKG